MRLLVTCAAMAAALMFSACSEVANREDFASQLKNKTEAQVAAVAGKPTKVDDADPKRVVWIYKGRTFDVTTRKTDDEADVIFAPSEDGKLHVVEVLFK